MNRGAIVLCGGKSSRMGESKAMLPFGPERMLQRVIRVIAETVPSENIVVATSFEQELPPLPQEVTIVHDRHSNRGPLEGLTCGLQALPTNVEVAFVTGCDTPLLEKGLVNKLFDLLGHHDIAIPRQEEFYHPLTAVYHSRVLAHAQAKLENNQLALHQFTKECDTNEVPIEELRDVDPDLLSFRNLNSIEDYQEALRIAKIPYTRKH